MTTWYILRHAEKAKGDYYNPLLRHQDEPISQKGRQDAEKLWAYFCAKPPIAAIYVSGYQRTRQTIEYVAEQLRLAPIVDERLNEIDNGLIEGLSDQEIQEQYPDVWKAYRERSADFRFPGGESGAEAQQRITSFLEEKRRQHGDEDILLVSHDGWIRLLICTILGLPVYHRWNFRVDFCGLMELSPIEESNSWKLIRFNQACLFNPLPAT